MKLQKIELTNWGPHKHISCDLDSPIVGIIGSNGKGKSFLLTAIAFAITGKLAMAKEKYIHLYNEDDESHSGKDYKSKVSLEFSIGGKKGTITREFSDSSSKRTLKFDDMTYTKQADVDAKMEQLIGADTAALMNAVFIKQGELTALIKGTPATRQEIFRKLMNLNFLSGRVDDLAAKIRMLDMNGIDYTPYIEKSKEIISRYEQLIKESEDKACDKDVLQKVQEYIKELKDVQRNVRDARHTTVRESTRLNTLENSYNSIMGGSTREDIEKSIQNVTIEYQRVQEILDTRLAFDSLKTVVDEYIKHLNNNTLIYIAIRDTEKYPDDMLAWIANEEEKSELALDIFRATNNIDKNTTWIKELEESLQKEKAVETSLEQKLRRLEFVKNKYDIRIKLLKNSDLSEVEICPCCGQQFNIEAILQDGESKDAALERITNLYNRFCEDVENDEKTLRVCKENINKAIENISIAKTRLKEFTDIKSTKQEAIRLCMEKKFSEECESIRKAFTGDLKELKQKVDENKAKIEKLRSELIPDSYMQAQKANADAASASIASIDEKYAFSTNPKHTVQALNDKKKVLTDALNSYEVTLKDADRCIKQIEDTRNIMSEDLYVLYQLKDKDASIQASILEVTNGYTSWEGILDNLDEIFEANKTRITIALNDISKWNTELEAEKKVLEDYLQKAANNEKIEQVKKDLQLMKSIISREGLPMYYMQEVFTQITSKVKEMLSMLGSNFDVEVDRTQPCTFTFTRLDTQDDFTMQQDVLSGGQAVRLAIALLMASQQIILPDVGLLVLDEPTSHVDTLGVTAMRNMFQEITSVLRSTGMQLIVVDHNEELQSGFSKVITL